MNNSAIEAIHFTIPVFCIATMFALGLTVTLAEIVLPFRNRLAMAILILANNVIVPLAAVLLLAALAIIPAAYADTVQQLTALGRPEQIGFLLLALSAGGVLAPALAALGKGSIALAKGTTMLLLLASLVLLPFSIWLLPQMHEWEAPFSVAGIFNTLLFYQLLPLALGMLIKARYDTLAGLLRPLINQLATLVFLVILFLLPTTGQGPISLPPEFPAVTVPLTSKPALQLNGLVEVLKQTSSVKGEAIAKGFLPISDTVSITVTAQLQKQNGAENLWHVVDAGKTYVVISQTEMITVSALMPYWFRVRPIPADVPGITSQGELVTTALTNTVILQAFQDHGAADVAAGQVMKQAASGIWLLRDAKGTYYALRKIGPSLVVYNQTVQSIPIIANMLEFLYQRPSVAAILDFLKELGILVAPLLVFAVVARLLLNIGYYAGVLINNATGTDALSVARTEALSAALRNVSVALIVAAKHFTIWPDPLKSAADFDISVLAIVLVFYAVSLVVAAVQADQWSREPELPPVAPANVK